MYNIRDVSGDRSYPVAELRERVADHKQVKREEDSPAGTPGFPPAVYGEEENRHPRRLGQERDDSPEMRDREAKQKNREG